MWLSASEMFQNICLVAPLLLVKVNICTVMLCFDKNCLSEKCFGIALTGAI